MNRGMNLPAIQKIMNEFEKESSMMDMKEEMMSDAIDDVMDDELEDEEEEGDKILKQVLDEVGVDLSQQARPPMLRLRPVINALYCSLRTRLLVCSPHLSPKAGKQLLWASLRDPQHQHPAQTKVQAEVGEGPLTMTLFRLVWTHYGRARH